jgi:exonuclease III
VRRSTTQSTPEEDGNHHDEEREGGYAPPSVPGEEHVSHGDEMPPKDENMMRLVLQNIHGAPLWSSLPENNNFRESFEYTQSDVYAMTELNTHWRNLPDKDKLHERMSTWFEARHQTIAYNVTVRPKRQRQYGGVGLISTNKMSHRVMGESVDASGLGRWCSTQYRGSNGLKLRVAVAYCPHDSGGDRSVYGQHRFYYNSMGKARAPRKAFWEDLTKEVKQWINGGDQVVLMGDWNEDVREVQRKHLGPLGLVEPLVTKHGPVPTYQRGSKAIDGIFLSKSLQMSQGGYLAFGEAMLSDH